MTGVDISASDSVNNLITWLNEKKIAYYFVKTLGDLVDDFNQNDLAFISSEGHIKKTIDEALVLIQK